MENEEQVFAPGFPRWVYKKGHGVSSGVLVNSAEEMPPGDDWTDTPTVNDVDPFSPHFKTPGVNVAENVKDARIAELEAQLAASKKPDAGAAGAGAGKTASKKPDADKA